MPRCGQTKTLFRTPTDWSLFQRKRLPDRERRVQVRLDACQLHSARGTSQEVPGPRVLCFGLPVQPVWWSGMVAQKRLQNQQTYMLELCRNSGAHHVGTGQRSRDTRVCQELWSGVRHVRQNRRERGWCGPAVEVVERTERRLSWKVCLFIHLWSLLISTIEGFNIFNSKIRLFLASFIKWNFTKFLVNRDGVVVHRYGPKDDPKGIEPDIVKLL